MCIMLDEANLINVVYSYKNVMKKDGGISALPSFAFDTTTSMLNTSSPIKP